MGLDGVVAAFGVLFDEFVLDEGLFERVARVDEVAGVGEVGDDWGFEFEDFGEFESFEAVHVEGGGGAVVEFFEAKG